MIKSTESDLSTHVDTLSQLCLGPLLRCGIGFFKVASTFGAKRAQS